MNENKTEKPPSHGGLAFPEVRIINGDNDLAATKLYYGGMRLRDYFAAKAMQTLLHVLLMQPIQPPKPNKKPNLGNYWRKHVHNLE